MEPARRRGQQGIFPQHVHDGHLIRYSRSRRRHDTASLPNAHGTDDDPEQGAHEQESKDEFHTPFFQSDTPELDREEAHEDVRSRASNDPHSRKSPIVEMSASARRQEMYGPGR